MNRYSLLEKIEPKLALKIKNDLDHAEIRGESASKICKWFERALNAEAILTLMRNDIVSLEGLYRGGMLFDQNNDTKNYER